MKLVVSLFLLALGVARMVDAKAAPVVHREDIEWCNVWIPDATNAKLPRVLLIGDSISMSYYDRVHDGLRGVATVARLSTSAAVADPALLDQVRAFLPHYRFDVIHVNVGLHGMDYTEDQYRAGLPRLLDLLRRRAPGARLIWATTTPWRKPAPDTASLHPNNERVKARNRIAAEIVTKRRLPIDDLYAPLESHPEYWSADGVHLNAEGQAVLAGCVLRTVRVALKGPEARGASRP